MVIRFWSIVSWLSFQISLGYFQLKGHYVQEVASALAPALFFEFCYLF